MSSLAYIKKENYHENRNTRLIFYCLHLYHVNILHLRPIQPRLCLATQQECKLKILCDNLNNMSPVFRLQGTFITNGLRQS